MPIEWPRIWGLPATDPDTGDYRKARDKAVEEIYKLRAGPIVGVSGSGTSHAFEAEARKLGGKLAQLGVTMTTGGLGGVMLDVTKGYVDGGKNPSSHPGSGKVGGCAIRILPKSGEGNTKKLYESLRGVEIVFTELPGRDSKNEKDHIGPSSRNHVLIATADAVICMPGSEGSIAEAKLAKQAYKKPVIAYAPANGAGPWDAAVAALGIPVVKTAEDAERWVRETLRLPRK